LNGQFLIEEAERGAAGIMPSSDIACVYVRVMDLLARGDRAEAWRIFACALPLIRFELQPGLGVSAAKHNLVARGVLRSARVRHPTSSIDAAAAADLETPRRLADAA